MNAPPAPGRRLAVTAIVFPAGSGYKPTHLTQWEEALAAPLEAGRLDVGPFDGFH